MEVDVNGGLSSNNNADGLDSAFEITEPFVSGNSSSESFNREWSGGESDSVFDSIINAGDSRDVD
jgi:hypothetical protein